MAADSTSGSSCDPAPRRQRPCGNPRISQGGTMTTADERSCQTLPDDNGAPGDAIGVANLPVTVAPQTDGTFPSAVPSPRRAPIPGVPRPLGTRPLGTSPAAVASMGAASSATTIPRPDAAVAHNRTAGRRSMTGNATSEQVRNVAQPKTAAGGLLPAGFSGTPGTGRWAASHGTARPTTACPPTLLRRCCLPRSSPPPPHRRQHASERTVM